MKKVGVYICECGPNIADNVDIERILASVSSMEESEGIEIVAKPYKLLCSGEGQEYLKEEIETNQLTHLVIGACSPRDHNSTFINVCKQTRLNPYLYKLINIREHCAWIVHDKEKATDKAIQYIRGGIRRVLYQSELHEKKLDINPDVLVIGGGIAGIEAALCLAGPERRVFLVEKSDKLGGKAAEWGSLLPRQAGGVKAIQDKIGQTEANTGIQVITKTRVNNIIGFLGNFEAELCQVDDPETTTDLTVGAIVVATGFRLNEVSSLPEFKSADSDEVYTTLDVERMLKEKGQVALQTGEKPKSVALIFCAGREKVGYCSQICCSTTIKIARQIKEQNPETAVKCFIRDLCLPHKDDQAFYQQARDLGVEFVRVQTVKSDGVGVHYTCMDQSNGTEKFDMVILAPAMEPAEGTTELSEILGIPLHETGFYEEAHQTINPVATATDGIFVAGTARGPGGVTATLNQAQAVAGKIMVQLIPGEQIVPEVKVSEILEAFCMGCKTCLDVCHYGAIVFDEDKGISVVKEAVCRGCGNCVGSCPSGAIQLKHFTKPQLYQEVIEALR